MRNFKDTIQTPDPTMDPKLLACGKIFIPPRVTRNLQHSYDGDECLCGSDELGYKYTPFHECICLDRSLLSPRDFVFTKSDFDMQTLHSPNLHALYKSFGEKERAVRLLPRPAFRNFDVEEDKKFLPLFSNSERRGIPDIREGLIYSLLSANLYKETLIPYFLESKAWTELNHPLK
jgi:hypothetical protein